MSQYPPQEPHQPPPWQQPYQPQYPQGQLPPQEPHKKTPSLRETWNSGVAGKCGILALVFVALLVCGACSGLVHAVTGSTQKADTTQGVTHHTIAPTKTVQRSSVALVKPTAKVKETLLTATAGTPHLGGNISDFIGKYGKDGNVSEGTAPSGADEVTITWTMSNGDGLRVDYYPSNDQVYSVWYTPTDNLSNEQIKAYLVQFFPADATVNSQAPNTDTLIAYSSSEYPHMFLHLSEGTGYINIV